MIGGIAIGWFSPSEAASIGVAGALLLAARRRQLNRAMLYKAFEETLKTSGMILLIIIGALIFSVFVSVTGLADAIGATVTGLGLGPVMTLTIVAIILLLLGSVLDGLGLMLLTTPILLPVVTSVGMSAIWFGIFLIRAMEIGFVHPPLGMNLYVMQGVAKDVPVARIFRGVVPFLVSRLSVHRPVHLLPGADHRPAAMARPVKPLASLGCDMPLDLLAATGRYAGPLAFDADRPTPRADQWLESKFAPWAFQILEDWADGALDHLDSVVFSPRRRQLPSASIIMSASCSGTGAIAGPEPLVFDVAHIRRASSLGRDDRAAARRLAEPLGVGETALEARPSAAPPAPAPEPAARTAPACLLAGTLPPDRRLHDAVERCGWTRGWRDVAGKLARPGVRPVDGEAGDPFVRLGQPAACRGGPGRAASATGSRRCSARARPRRARGAVILWFCEHDEARGLARAGDAARAGGRGDARA